MLICEAVDPDGKTCLGCAQYKRLDQFCNTTRGKYGKHGYCKVCQNEATKRRRKADPDKSNAASRKSHLKALCGISPEQWQEAWDNQAGLCSICTTPLRRGVGGAATDHDHDTDQFRALLCGPCNTAIGKLRDNPELMRKAADYVEFHRAKIA